MSEGCQMPEPEGPEWWSPEDHEEDCPGVWDERDCACKQPKEEK